MVYSNRIHHSPRPHPSKILVARIFRKNVFLLFVLFFQCIYAKHNNVENYVPGWLGKKTEFAYSSTSNAICQFRNHYPASKNSISY